MSSTPALPQPQRSRITAITYPGPGFLVDFEYRGRKGFTEELVQGVVAALLEREGYSVKTGGRLPRGPDLEAFSTRGRKIVVEAKGEGSRPEMFRNFFQAALGQIILRMNDDRTIYIVALPCHDQFVRLVRLVPRRVFRALNLHFWLIEATQGILDYHIHVVESDAQ